MPTSGCESGIDAGISEHENVAPRVGCKTAHLCDRAFEASRARRGVEHTAVDAGAKRERVHEREKHERNRRDDNGLSLMYGGSRTGCTARSLVRKWIGGL